jgi:hypothetical protein
VLLICGRLFQADGRTIDVAAGLLRGLFVTVREQGGRDSIHGWAMETPARGGRSGGNADVSWAEDRAGGTTDFCGWARMVAEVGGVGDLRSEI